VRAPAPEGAVARLVAGGVEPPLALLLAQRGVERPEAARDFLAPSLERLSPASDLPGLDGAVDRLSSALDDGARIRVLGDYDADGVTSTALLAAALRSLGAESLSTFLPRRDADGYGLQVRHVEAAAEDGVDVLVVVDSGTSAVDAHEAARALGLDLVILDHHLSDQAPREGPLLVNPRLGALPEAAELTAAGLSLRVAAALLERRGREVPWDALLRIACLGTIADVAPLTGDNRVIAALGLAALRVPRSVGLRALGAAARLHGEPTAADVAFRLAPRLNAAGRLGAADPALELLLTRDRGRAEELAAELERRNAERQTIERRIVDGARRQVLERGDPPPVVVAWSDAWHRGVVGIAAAKLARELHRPTVLLAVEGDEATGSGRSVGGISLHELLRPWSDRLERFGGHAQAVGLTARTERLPALREAWEEAATPHSEVLRVRERRFHLEVALADAGPELASLLGRVAPFGAGNPEPILRIVGARVAASRPFGRGHLRLDLEGAGGTLTAVAWRFGERFGELPDGPLELFGALEADRYDGLRLRVEDLRPESAPATV